MPAAPPSATPGDDDLDPRAADRARATAIANARDAPRKIDVHWMTSELIAAWNRLDMLTAELARLDAALAAVASWGQARRREAVAIQASYAANHRGPAWFARCVAGEQRADAEQELFAAWEAYDAATGAGQEGDA